MLHRETKRLPLHWFRSLMLHAVSPFSEAATLERYATNGYYLLGITLATITLLFWLSGPLPNPLPPDLRDSLRILTERAGLKGLAEISFVIVLALIYVLVYFIKSVRFFVGEKFADAFFKVADAGIKAGEWCVEHRWWSLLIVLVLVFIIVWGFFYIFQAPRHRDTFT